MLGAALSGVALFATYGKADSDPPSRADGPKISPQICMVFAVAADRNPPFHWAGAD